MSYIKQTKVLILDCQTTAMHPTQGHILQLGWAVSHPELADMPVCTKHILKLPENQTIPNKIKKLLNISSDSFSHAQDPVVVLKQLLDTIVTLGPKPYVIIHYAQFELSFLRHYFSTYLQMPDLPFTTICSQKLSKKLLPNLPSYNLKALAGYFNFSVQPVNEVTSHVVTTAGVWNIIIERLLQHNVVSFEGLHVWSENYQPKLSCTAIQYQVDRLLRLNLPTKPGIYRMLSNNRRVLYVGKATSLKSRVNSYFRGSKNRDTRKLEMLAQVWTIETVQCASPIEAELLEADEIKKCDPPYNIRLKESQHVLMFYNQGFTAFANTHGNGFTEGPFKVMDAVCQLFSCHHDIICHRESSLFGTLITAETLAEAWSLFCLDNQIDSDQIKKATPRKLLAIGYQHLRSFEKTNPKYSFEKWWAGQKKSLPMADMNDAKPLAEKLARTFLRAAETRRKSKMLLKIVRATILVHSSQTVIRFINHPSNTHLQHKQREPESLPINTALYDKLSIIYSAKKKQLVSLTT
jgi:DNA polymerase-3 subunit epsilon